MRNLIRLAFVSLLVGVISSASADERKAADGGLRLGMIAPLTGNFAPYGEDIRRGIEMAAEELKHKGIPVKVFYEDACLPAQARAALSKLVSIHQIDALVGSYCVVGMLASEAILEKAKVIAFQTSGGTTEILNTGEFLFTSAGRTVDEAVELANHAFQKLHARKAAILSLTTQWGEEFKDAFATKFESLGGHITGSETNPIGVNEFRAELTRLKKGSPDILVIIHLAQTLGEAIKESRELGLGQTILTTADAESPSVIDAAGEYAEGLQFFAPEPKVETAEMRKFALAFQKRFDHEAPPLSRHSYDATMLSVSALTECQGDRQCAKSKLYQVKNYSGASGVFSIEMDGGVKREFVLKMVKDGRFLRASE